MSPTVNNEGRIPGREGALNELDALVQMISPQIHATRLALAQGASPAEAKEFGTYVATLTEDVPPSSS